MMVFVQFADIVNLCQKLCVSFRCFSSPANGFKYRLAVKTVVRLERRIGPVSATERQIGRTSVTVTIPFACRAIAAMVRAEERHIADNMRRHRFRRKEIAFPAGFAFQNVHLVLSVSGPVLMGTVLPDIMFL